MGGFDWHKEQYDKALRAMSNAVGKRYAAWIEGLEAAYATGWLTWFEATQPELYKKYAAAEDRIQALWGDMSPAAMEEFKAAVKVEVEATVWAVDKFLEYQAQLAREERLRGRQEEMAL